MRKLAFATLVVPFVASIVATAQTTGASPPMLEPDRARFGAPTCRVSTPREVGRSSVRNLRLRVASQPAPRTSTLAMWSTGEHVLSSRAIGAELGNVQTIELADGMNLSVLSPVSEGRFVAISVGALCSGRARGYSCLRAVGLDAHGAPTGPAHAPTPADQQLMVVSSAELRAPDGSPTGVALALAARWTGADITLFRLDAAGNVVVEPHPIRSEGPSDAPVRRLVADGEQVVALGAQSSFSDADNPFVLPLGHRRRIFARAVPEDAPLRWARARGVDLELFYALPRQRLRWLRVSGLDGRFVEGTPTTIEPTDPLPADPIFPALEVTGGSLTLQRTDLRGAVVGEATSLASASGRVVTSSSWDGSALHVVWGARVGREWVISESSVTCAMGR